VMWFPRAQIAKKSGLIANKQLPSRCWILGDRGGEQCFEAPSTEILHAGDHPVSQSTGWRVVSASVDSLRDRRPPLSTNQFAVRREMNVRRRCSTLQLVLIAVAAA
jgi:hypothetical protein